MITKPYLPVAFPTSKQAKRDGVTQAKRDKVNRANLLPMRQAIAGLADIRVRIEKLKLVHSGGGQGILSLRVIALEAFFKERRFATAVYPGGRF
jgi:hypothetical protein